MLLGERGGQARLTGHVVADRGIDLIAVRAALAEVLPAYLVPAALVRHDRLPITVQGKVDRRALAAVVPDGPVVDTDLTPAQRAVARIWTAVLGIPQVRQNDDFLALGGDSLDAIRMISALRHEHGVQLTLSRLYAAPTLAEVANLVTSVGTAGRPRRSPWPRASRWR